MSKYIIFFILASRKLLEALATGIGSWFFAIHIYFRTMCKWNDQFSKIVRDLETRPTLKAVADNLLKIVGTYLHTQWSDFQNSVQNLWDIFVQNLLVFCYQNCSDLLWEKIVLVYTLKKRTFRDLLLQKQMIKCRGAIYSIHN